MPLDGIVSKNIVYELKQNIINSKIDKIYQPEKDEIIISIRSFTGSYKLLLSANANYPRIHLTNINKENPQAPPMFCMFLRKHLLGGKIIDIFQPGLERIIELHIISPNQIGDMTLKKLIIEIMGKHSNIILVDENNKVLDSIKHITHEISRVREVLPGSNYFYPPSDKLNPIDVDFEQFKNLFESNKNSSPEKILLNNFNGFGTIISKELVYRCSENIDNLWNEFSKIKNQIINNTFEPTLYYDKVTNSPKDFSSINLSQYSDYELIKMDSIGQVIEKYYGTTDQKNRVNQKTEDMRKHLKIILDRNTKKLETLSQKIDDCSDKDKYKVYGDLIFANIYAITDNQKQLEVVNYFSEEQEKIIIPLDQQLTPSENAQKYYKKYNKLQNTIKASTEILENTKNEIEYIESVLNNIDICISELDIEQIRVELSEQGYMKSSNNNKKKNKVISKPMNYISSDGFDIFVGKNNIQNDELTLKFASKNDIWFHTKLIHGSHVIIKCDNKQVPDTTLIEAATLAAYYSKAKNSSNVQVDYTIVKNVKKPSGAKPGMVIYVEYKTIVVTPSEEVVNKVIKK